MKTKPDEYVEKKKEEFRARFISLFSTNYTSSQLDWLDTVLKDTLAEGERRREQSLREEIEGMKINKSHVSIGNMEFQVESLYADGHDKAIEDIKQRLLTPKDL